MSFSITLYQNLSPDKKIGKKLREITTLTGTVRDETSIINPVILVEDNTSLSACNYMFIPEFGRYYFITDVKKPRAGVAELWAHSDGLNSFSGEILANTAVIESQENKWNLYIDDGRFRVYNNPIVITKAFPSGFSNPSYILAVTGNNTSDLPI